MAKPRKRPEKPLTKQATEFVIHHLADKTAFHPFTGTDWDAWNAYVPLVRLWGRMRNEATATALRAVVAATRRGHGYDLDVLSVFKKAIPCLLDWSDERALWMQIGPLAAPLRGEDPMRSVPLWPCADGPRVCEHERSTVYSSGMDPDYRECKGCGAIWRPSQATVG